MSATETASGGSPAPLAASVEALATASARQAEEGASPQPSSAPDIAGFYSDLGEAGVTTEQILASQRQPAHDDERGVAE